LKLEHTGGGKPWVTFQALAAIPLKEPFTSGYRIKRSVIPVEQKEKGRWSRGDLVRVSLEINAQTDMSWVAVQDPIPTGASILGTGLGRDSSLATQGESQDGGWPAFQERSFEAFRAYYEWLPKGDLKVQYTLRLNQPGSMNLAPTRVEAMYAPEMLGEIPNAIVVVHP
jgi:alpha-2-macroglobulin